MIGAFQYYNLQKGWYLAKKKEAQMRGTNIKNKKLTRPKWKQHIKNFLGNSIIIIKKRGIWTLNVLTKVQH